MSCDEVQALLSDLLDGAGSDDALETAAAAHLEGCSACARVARELGAVHRLILEARAADLLAAAKPRAAKRRRPLPSRSNRALPLSIAACLVLGFAAYFGLRGRPTPPPRVFVDPVPTLGSVEVLEGRAWRRRSGAETALAGKQFLEFADGVRVEGRVRMTWRDDTRLELGEGSLVERFEETREGKAVLLARGSLSADVRPQPAGHPLAFLTPHGRALVLGTTLSLRVDKATRLEVTTGKVELRNDAGKSVLVDAGHYAVAAPGRDLVARKVEPPGWRDATSNLGGPVWGRGGVTLLAAVPGRDEIVAGVHDAWLWASSDGGASWRPLGNDGAPIRNMPHHLVFDPADPRVFWVSAIYGPGLYRTSDGGASFKRLGGLEHIDGLAVDFSDPARRTILATKHLDAGGLMISTDGGESFRPLGDRLPAPHRSSSMPFILDSKTFLVDGSGSDGSGALYRSADAGATWSHVSPTLPAGPPLLASDGALYWQPKAGLGDAILKSTDRGLTWTPMRGPSRLTPVEIGPGRLLAIHERQMFVSGDGAVSWEKFGEPTPITSLRTFCGMTYETAVFSDAGRALYVWKGATGRSAETVFRRPIQE